MGQSTAEILFGFSSSPPPPPPRLSSLRDSGAGPALRETRSSDGGTSTGETRVRADGQFEWVVRAAPKGRGLKKRKLLLRALAEAWTVAAQEDGEERPVVRRMAIYRAMKGAMAAKQVAISSSKRWRGRDWWSSTATGYDAAWRGRHAQQQRAIPPW